MTLSIEIMKPYTSLYDNFAYANKLFNTAENNLELSSFENQIRKTEECLIDMIYDKLQIKVEEEMDLRTQIDFLFEQGFIDKASKSALHTVRICGNRGSHNDDNDMKYSARRKQDQEALNLLYSQCEKLLKKYFDIEKASKPVKKNNVESGASSVQGVKLSENKEENSVLQSKKSKTNYSDILDIAYYRRRYLLIMFLCCIVLPGAATHIREYLLRMTNYQISYVYSYYLLEIFPGVCVIYGLLQLFVRMIRYSTKKSAIVFDDDDTKAAFNKVNRRTGLVKAIMIPLSMFWIVKVTGVMWYYARYEHFFKGLGISHEKFALFIFNYRTPIFIVGVICAIIIVIKEYTKK